MGVTSILGSWRSTAAPDATMLTETFSIFQFRVVSLVMSFFSYCRFNVRRLLKSDDSSKKENASLIDEANYIL